MFRSDLIRDQRLLRIEALDHIIIGEPSFSLLREMAYSCSEMREALSFPPFSNHGAQKISKTFWACYGSFFHCSLRR